MIGNEEQSAHRCQYTFISRWIVGINFNCRNPRSFISFNKEIINSITRMWQSGNCHLLLKSICIFKSFFKQRSYGNLFPSHNGVWSFLKISIFGDKVFNKYITCQFQFYDVNGDNYVNQLHNLQVSLINGYCAFFIL